MRKKKSMRKNIRTFFYIFLLVCFLLKCEKKKPGFHHKEILFNKSQPFSHKKCKEMKEREHNAIQFFF